jgi:hypothetical protein
MNKKKGGVAFKNTNNLHPLVDGAIVLQGSAVAGALANGAQLLHRNRVLDALLAKGVPTGGHSCTDDQAQAVGGEGGRQGSERGRVQH